MTWQGLNPPYSTIVADPPWEYGGSGGELGAKTGRSQVKDRRPGSRYSTMPPQDIQALPVQSLAATNSHLYLWVTNSDLRQGLDVLEAWGFVYKTAITWVKKGRPGLGAYFRTQTEHVLFGVRGSLGTLSRIQYNVFEAPRRRYSVKPSEFGDIVEVSSPGPYLELFARQPRLGWDSWGWGYESGGESADRTLAAVTPALP